MLDFDLAETRAGQEIFQEGMEKGIEKGLEKGIEKGKLEGLIEAIKMGMELKFGIEGLKLLPRIEKEKNITRLDAIKEAIKIAITIKEIEELLVN